MGCYRKLGCPVVINEKVLECARLIDRIYDFHPCGGRAHIVVDDWNLEDDHIRFCLGWRPSDEFPDEREASIAALEAMLALSMDERATAMAIHDHFISA